MLNKLYKLRFLFFTLAPNDRGYAHLRFAGAFAVVERQGKCGSKAAGMHSLPRSIGGSQPMNRRVLAVCSFVLSCRVWFSVV